MVRALGVQFMDIKENISKDGLEDLLEGIAGYRRPAAGMIN